MCGLCGLIAAEVEWGDELNHSSTKRSYRLKKIQIMNIFLKSYRVKISDFQGVNYLLETPTGKRSLANGLNEIWQQVSQLTGYEIDVLDEDMLIMMEKNN